MSWHKIKLETNEGKKLDVYENGEYLICLNINKGLDAKTGVEDGNGHRWWFELTHTALGHERFVGEAPTLAGAKRLARLASSKSTGSRSNYGPEVREEYVAILEKDAADGDVWAKRELERVKLDYF